MKYIDLHTHSTFSDGTNTPAELIDKARKRGLSYLALTDHDTTAGLEPFQTYGAQFSDITLINGIELSISYTDGPFALREFHMLGLGFDKENKKLLEQIEILREQRLERNHKIVQLLQEEGINITYEELIAKTSKGVLTRTHFASALFEKGYTQSLDDSFRTYFRRNVRTNIPKICLPPKEAITLIHQAGGVAVFAHPMRYGLEQAQVEMLLTMLRQDGLDGVEAYYFNHTQSDDRFVKKQAKLNNLLVSGGSDYHGSNRDVDLGIGRGNLKIPETLWLELDARRQRHHD